MLGKQDVLNFPRRALRHDGVKERGEIAHLNVNGVGCQPRRLLGDEAVQHDRAGEAVGAAIRNGASDAVELGGLVGLGSAAHVPDDRRYVGAVLRAAPQLRGKALESSCDATALESVLPHQVQKVGFTDIVLPVAPRIDEGFALLGSLKKTEGV